MSSACKPAWRERGRLRGLDGHLDDGRRGRRRRRFDVVHVFVRNRAGSEEDGTVREPHRSGRLEQASFPSAFLPHLHRYLCFFYCSSSPRSRGQPSNMYRLNSYQPPSPSQRVLWVRWVIVGASVSVLAMSAVGCAAYRSGTKSTTTATSPTKPSPAPPAIVDEPVPLAGTPAA